MQDRTINSALLALRKQIIRGDGQGLDKVEALLEMRGVPMPRVMPARRADASRHGLMSIIVLDALRDSPKALRDIVAHVAARRPELEYLAAYTRTTQVLAKLKLKGLVRREGTVWLAP